MFERKYSVLDETGTIIARDMTLDVALLLMEAYAQKYYADTSIILVLKGQHEELSCDG